MKTNPSQENRRRVYDPRALAQSVARYLRRNGWSFDEIGPRLGVDSSTARKWCAEVRT